MSSLRRPRFFAFAAGALVALASVPLPQLSTAASADVSVGQTIAPFTLPDPSGHVVTVGHFDAAKATVLIFVSTRCPVSNAYDGRMVKLGTDYSAQGVHFYGINANRTESPEEVAQHAQAHGFPFPVLKDQDDAIADRFGAQVTPEVFVIDSAGKLVYHGQIDNNMNIDNVSATGLRDALGDVLAGKPVANPESRAFGCSIKR